MKPGKNPQPVPEAWIGECPPIDPAHTVYSAFEKTAITFAQNTALELAGTRLTYHDLRLKAEALAGHLHALGLKPGEPVGLCMDRSVEMITSMLAILRCGGCFVPFDPAYPAERLSFMMKDTGCRLLLTQRSLAAQLPKHEARVVYAEDFPVSGTGPTCEGRADAAAYIMYTSGSTGTPKGVVVPHRAILRLVQDQNFLPFGPELTFLQLSNTSFDASTLEIWGALLNGGRLVLLMQRQPTLREIAEAIGHHHVNTLWLTSGLFNLMVDEQLDDLRPLKHLLAGGDVLSVPHVRKAFSVLGPGVLINGYGPTENTTFTCCHRIMHADDIGDSVPIGKPIRGTTVHVLDGDMRPVDIGMVGELFTGGDGVAQGYWNRPELTAERFIDDPFPGRTGAKLYRTGDLVHWLPNGTIAFQGRTDDQVKVRGFRIELGEIENALSRFPGVKDRTVVVLGEGAAEKQLAGYIVPADASLAEEGAAQETWIQALRTHLSTNLPEHMVPNALVVLPTLPLNPNGKVDRRALPAPKRRTAAMGPQQRPATPLEKALARVWSEILGVEDIGVEDNFFQLGGNSLLSIRLVARLEATGIQLPIVKLYQHPTLRDCAAWLAGDVQTTSPADHARQRMEKRSASGQSSMGSTSRDIAIIGMSGRFPGSGSVADLWRDLLAKKSGITTWHRNELDPHIPEELRNDPLYVPARGVIADADKFDAAFFGVNPKLAALMDPQQRIFLEMAWSALEDAGYDPGAYKSPIGVYAGMYNNTYFTRNVIGNRDLIEQVGEFQVMTANEKDYIATRLAFEFDLRGPALSIHTACSTSLVAIAQATKALRDGDCDMALAGGVAITVPINSGVLYNEGGMYSPDGHTRTFDASGKGTSFSDGVAIVVLKRLDDAIRDGDHVHAVIKGVALNNDGSEKASFTAPSVRGQAEVVAMAQADAGVDPKDISYVEAHGTATPLGDPIEVEALTLAFRNDGAIKGQDRNEHAQWCALGSVKSNIGHLTIAAGATGVIKTALALEREVIPASLGYEKPNPAIDFAKSPFRVAQDNLDWPRVPGKPRIAGVSSFGVGGTNAHVILGEAPALQPTSTSRDRQLFLLSAKSKASLDAMTENLRAWLEANPKASLADAAYTLQIGRRHFKHRRYLVGGSHGELAEAIANKDVNLTGTRELHEAAPGVVFMFPGQGSQYVNMGRDLWESEPVFKEHFDRCCELFSKELHTDLKAIIFPKAGEEDMAAGQLKQTIHTQASLFTMHYSLARLWMHWGIVPDAMMGHSIGEFAAACLAGVFSLEDAIKLVANRGRMMQELPGGSMLSIRTAEEDVAGRLPEGCSIAANNGPQLCVASGPAEAIAQLQSELEKEGITCKLLVTSHAFHSPMMDPMVEPYRKVVEGVKLHVPRIPIISTVTTQWLKDADATSPAYWSDHLRATVRFAQAVKFAWEDAPRVMLEVGPRTTATTLARQQSTDNKKQVAVPSLGDSAGHGNELTQLLKAVGGLWQSGVPIDWSTFYERETRRRTSMPTYAFERTRHWVEPVAMQVAVHVSQGQVATVGTGAPVEILDTDLSPKDQLIARIRHLLEDSSGLELANASNEDTFLEMGLDSLFLTQVATSLSRTFGVKVSFRQLNEEFPNLDRLADHLLANGVGSAAGTQAQGASAGASATDQRPTTNALEDAPELKKVFGAQARIQKEKVDDMTPHQRAWFDDFVKRYTAKTAKSKAYTQEHRMHMADPRVVTGFKPQTKEITYQVVVERSRGCHMWDLDGNEYVDILSGFGSSFFGYMPDFIREACHKQLEAGTEIGPMNALAGEVSQLLCEMTGHERSAVCNTGSEAVMGCMRMARTVTGRSLIIAFSGSYHGIVDEVIVRGSKSGKSYPAAPGILPESVHNILILDYGTPESLEIIKQRCHEAAAILVEPVQSRRMEFRPVDFLHELRRITKEHGTALIFDEVITGFRMHPQGAQGLFGIRADIAAYGKVPGGGMTCGIMIGDRPWMDALDGGWWQFGDESVPEAGVTYFAGTFVRHPLTLAAIKAVMHFLKEQGPGLQERMNAMTEDLVARGNGLFEKYKLPYYWVNFGSAYKTKYDESVNYTELFFLLMRYHGVHVLDFPHFLTTSHTEADVEFILEALEKTCKELRASGFMPERTYTIPTVNSVLGGHLRKLSERVISAMEPPVSGARLGRTPKGEPAWFIPDPKRQGRYLMIETDEN
ncbi:MAG: amino acid adenylation domain-containing protein [Flavobacteriales bacterium]|nr:amino acid adenylation domain-containing protein [Flavobacteriales bacterium]